ncbi:MAG: DUF3821 domain-containing protein [Methanoregulaceae archaeon]|nr:DUF3821 domain-containing protein [Methanoregulaceae archaeon]
MVKWLTWCAVVAFIGIPLFVLPASGSLYTIPQGGTAFIGEQGLDISQTGVIRYEKIGWFGTGRNGTSGDPLATVSVEDTNNFYIDPLTFGGRTGPWYTLPNKTIAFYVEDPSLDLKILDETMNYELTEDLIYVPKGDQVGFRIETNLVSIVKRPGISSVPITIHVRQPNGDELAEVSGYKLIDIGVAASPFSTGPVWDTTTYPSGTYTVWAVCNVNHMKDNYPVNGKTETPTAGNLQILSPDQLITPPVTPTPTRMISNTTQVTAATTESVPPALSAVPTSEPPTTAQAQASPTEVPGTIPTATTKAPGPDIALILGVIGIAAAMVTRGKR